MFRIVRTSDDVTFSLIPFKTYTVGRKQGDILLASDPSISRLHAELLVTHPYGNINEPLLTPTLSIIDVGSKFGTYATEDGIRLKNPINARESVTLAIGDKFRFGLSINEFRIEYTPMVVTTSSCKANSEFKETITHIGGHLVGEWDDNVTHVVMESITLTIKAVCALLKAKPIITKAYLQDLLSAFESSQTLPDPVNYIPPVTERGIINVEKTNFAPNSARTTLFAGKTFLLCNSKHMKKMQGAIHAGGGIAMMIQNAKYKDVKSDEFIIMGTQADTTLAEKDLDVKTCLQSYKKSGKRFIQDSEVGLAAVYNSIEKHCNPRCKVTDGVMPHLPTQSQNGSSAPLIVPETQNLDSQPSTSANASRRVVNDTIVNSESGGSQSSSRLDKRPHPSSSDEGSESSSSKKRSATDSLSRRTSKRLREAPKPPIISADKSSKTLNSLFGFGDSDEDEQVVAIVPETQRTSTADSDEGGPEVVAESQPQLVNIVDVRNLQSIAGTQESNVSMQQDDDDLFVVPASPPERSQSIAPNLGTDNISTVTVSIMNAPTIPAVSESLDSTVNSPRSRLNTSRNKNLTPVGSHAKNDAVKSNGESSKKRPREEEEVDSPISVKKINLTDLKVKTEHDDSVTLVSAPLIVKPLVNKNMLRRECSFVNGAEPNCTKKNFKVFKKVLPSFAAKMTPSGRGSKAKDSNADASFLIEEIRAATKAIKLVPYSYSPGSDGIFVEPPVVASRRQIDTPPAFDVLEEFDVLPQQRSPVKRGTRRQEAGPSSVQETVQRRSSPRKKAPPPVRKAPPPPSISLAPVETPEDDDDMWSFN